jgi:hypothetical protein
MAELRQASHSGRVRNAASPVLRRLNREGGEVGEMVAKLWMRFGRRWCGATALLLGERGKREKSEHMEATGGRRGAHEAPMS